MMLGFFVSFCINFVNTQCNLGSHFPFVALEILLLKLFVTESLFAANEILFNTVSIYSNELLLSSSLLPSESLPPFVFVPIPSNLFAFDTNFKKIEKSSFLIY
jgi:hypothetical protein